MDPDVEMMDPDPEDDTSSILSDPPTVLIDPRQDDNNGTQIPPPMASRDPKEDDESSSLTPPPTVLKNPPEDDEDSSSLTPPTSTLIKPEGFDADVAEMISRASPLNNDYIKIGKVGKGGQGIVYLLQHKRTRVLVVAKVVRQPLHAGAWPEEARLMSYDPVRNHPHILTLVNCYPHQPTAKQCTIVTEFCNGRDLRHFGRLFHDRNVRVPESFLWHAIKQISSALAFLHHGTKNADEDYKIIHRDLKPRNILLDWEEKDVEGLPNLKLADLGLATSIMSSDEDHDYTFDYGTYEWQPPERPIACEAADVWALGASIHWLATKSAPVEHPPSDHTTSTGGIHQWYKNAERYAQNLTLFGYSPFLTKIVTEFMLEKDPEVRASSKEVADLFDEVLDNIIDKYGEGLPEWACVTDNRFQIEDEEGDWEEGDEVAESS